MKTIRAMACIYKLTKDSKWQDGIAIGHDIGDITVIYNMDMKPIPEPHIFRCTPEWGCIAVNSGA